MDPRDHADSLAGDRADPLARDRADLPARDRADPPAREGADPPAREGADPPARDGADPPARDGVDPPAGDRADPPARDHADPLARDRADPPAREGADPPARDGVDPPAGDRADPPARDHADPLAGDRADLLARDRADPPARDGADPPAGDRADPPARDHADPLARDRADPPAREGADPPARDGADPPAGDRADPPARDHADPLAGDRADPPARDRADQPAREGADPPARDHADLLAGDRADLLAGDRADLLARDRADPLARFRDRFRLPEGIVYLDGNSLGPPPRTVSARVERLIAGEWGADLIASWNRHGWFRLAERVGARIAPLLGAGEDEVIAADSVSLNLFKLLGALLRRAGDRRVVLADESNFPTDLYMAEGLVRLLRDSGAALRLVAPEEFESALGPDVAVATRTQVDFRSGRLEDLAGLTAAARRRGVPLVWDLSHSAGAVPLQLKRDGVEFAVGCGYKYLNGGPGAPAFLYVARAFQESLESPLSGWMGHARPFDFETRYRPATGMRRFLVGTPPILSMVALEEGLRSFEGVDLIELRRKSETLGDLFLRLADERLAAFGVAPASPRDAGERGSQISLRHPDAYPVMQALIARGVVGDFREPDLLRFGLAPLHVRRVDIWDAVEALRAVLESGEYRRPGFRRRKPVT